MRRAARKLTAARVEESGWKRVAAARRRGARSRCSRSRTPRRRSFLPAAGSEAATESPRTDRGDGAGRRSSRRGRSHRRQRLCGAVAAAGRPGRRATLSNGASTRLRSLYRDAEVERDDLARAVRAAKRSAAPSRSPASRTRFARTKSARDRMEPVEKLRSNSGCISVKCCPLRAEGIRRPLLLARRGRQGPGAERHCGWASAHRSRRRRALPSRRSSSTRLDCSESPEKRANENLEEVTPSRGGRE